MALQPQCPLVSVPSAQPEPPALLAWGQPGFSGAQSLRHGSRTACCPTELLVGSGAWARLRLPHLPGGCFSAGAASPPSSGPVLVNISVPPCSCPLCPAGGLRSLSPGPHLAVCPYCVHRVSFSVNTLQPLESLLCADPDTPEPSRTQFCVRRWVHTSAPCS